VVTKVVGIEPAMLLMYMDNLVSELNLVDDPNMPLSLNL
jgi:hypothetical protein